MNNLLETYNKTNYFGHQLGMHFKETKPGEVHYFIEITKEHLATPTAAHGGVIAAFMDAVAGVAALSLKSLENKLVSTIEFKISYFKPVKLGDSLTGIGKVDFSGKRIVYSTGEIFNQNNELVAKGMGSFNAYPISKSDIKVDSVL